MILRFCSDAQRTDRRWLAPVLPVCAVALALLGFVAITGCETRLVTLGKLEQLEVGVKPDDAGSAERVSMPAGEAGVQPSLPEEAGVAPNPPNPPEQPNAIIPPIAVGRDEPLLMTVDPSGDPDCVPIITTCNPRGGQYCGLIGDGCGGQVTCSDSCPGDWVCSKGLCMGDSSCEPLASCELGGVAACGPVGDGCGHRLQCGNCPPGFDCEDRVCRDPSCVPLKCESDEVSYCGQIGDGCGGTVDCGVCTGGAVCGGGGIPGICAGGDDCTPVNCQLDGGGEYCGVIGDGCGGTVDCGDCSDGAECGGGGNDNVCEGSFGAACVGLRCQVDACQEGVRTTLSGTVFDPAGVLPLYNALVYVPNAALDPVADGATCGTCDVVASGSPITNALTDVDGNFTLENVPSGTDIPLVIQVGKWRRQVVLPRVDGCANNAVSDRNLTRLPRNRFEGHIPQMAVSTGNAEALECLLLRIGLDESEFTTPEGNGRVHLYAGGDPEVVESGDHWAGVGATALANGDVLPAASTELWADRDRLMDYDMLLYSCEGKGLGGAKMGKHSYLEDYVAAGGKAYLSHMHFNWLRQGTSRLKQTAEYIGVGEELGQEDKRVIGQINTSFPKGQALADWLFNTGATSDRGSVEILQGQHSVAGVNPPTTAWITVPAEDTVEGVPSIQYMSFNAPVGAKPAEQCGRVVLTDLHLKTAVGGAGGDDSDPTQPFPQGCKDNGWTPQAQVLAFMFFDLSSCVQPDDEPPGVPIPPPIVPGAAPVPGPPEPQRPPPPLPPLPPPPVPPIAR